MKILYLIDSADEDKNSQFHNWMIFQKMSSILPGKFFQTDLQYSDLSDNYYIDCFNQSIYHKFQAKFKNLLSFHESYDLVITNSPNDLIREIFPFVLNLSIGIYSRPPFSYYFQLDPWGMFWKSYTYNSPRFGLENFDLAEKFKNKLNLEKIHDNIFLFPFNSEYWPLQIQKLPKSQIEYYQEIKNKFGNVHWTKKPNFSLHGTDHSFDYEYLKTLPYNLQLHEDSSLLIPSCKKIWTTHSTLGFQAALFGVEIISPSCFYYWKGNQVGTIGHLLETVWFDKIKEMPERIEKLKEIKLPTKLRESFRSLKEYIEHDTHFYRL